jgi:hypothetical protein
MCWFISHTSQWWRFDTGVVTSCVTVLVLQCIHSHHTYVTPQRPSFDPRPVCGICDRQGDHGIGLCHCTFVLTCQCYSTDVPHSHFIHPTGTVRGADKSLARPGRKEATVTEDFDFHISYL